MDIVPYLASEPSVQAPIRAIWLLQSKDADTIAYLRHTDRHTLPSWRHPMFARISQHAHLGAHSTQVTFRLTQKPEQATATICTYSLSRTACFRNPNC